MTSDIVAIVCFFFGMTYFALAGGPDAFRRTCKGKPGRLDVNDNDFKTTCDDFRQLGATSLEQ